MAVKFIMRNTHIDRLGTLITCLVGPYHTCLQSTKVRLLPSYQKNKEKLQSGGLLAHRFVIRSYSTDASTISADHQWVYMIWQQITL